MSIRPKLSQKELTEKADKKTLLEKRLIEVKDDLKKQSAAAQLAAEETKRQQSEYNKKLQRMCYVIMQRNQITQQNQAQNIKFKKLITMLNK